MTEAVPAWIDELTKWANVEAVTHVIPSHGRLGGRDLMLGTASYLQSLIDGVDEPGGSAMQRFYRDTHIRNVQATFGNRT